MSGVVRLVGQVLGGLVVIGCVVCWAAWRWVTGAPWRRGWRGRRWVTRPVRATAQSGVTAVVVGLWLAPAVTVWVLVCLVLLVAGAAAGWRVKQRLDRRVLVTAGPVIPHQRAAASRRQPLTARARAAQTRRLIRDLEAT